MIVKLQNWRTRLAETFAWKSLKQLLWIDTFIAVLLAVIFAHGENWGRSFLIFLICSHIIGAIIFFLVNLSGVLEIASLWKRALVLAGIFVLGGAIGASLTLGLLRLVLQVDPVWPSLLSWLKNSTIFALLFGALVTGYFIVRDRLEENAARLAEKEINEQRLLQLKTKAELEALRAKINPHFLFNALNSIASLIPVDAPAAEKMVERLARLFRSTLETSNRETVALFEELALVREYLEIEKVRLGERLSYTIAVDEELLDLPVPGLLLQPLVENSVKHGISPRKNGGQIAIQCRRENDCFCLEVHDTGRGFDEAKGAEGFGLSSVRERLALHYGERYEFYLHHENGVRVTMKLPLMARAGESHEL